MFILVWEVKKMSLSFAIVTILEIAAVLLLVFGFMHEKKVIAFERRVMMIIVVNLRRYKRKKALMKQQSEWEKRTSKPELHTVKTPQKSKASHRVA